MVLVRPPWYRSDMLRALEVLPDVRESTAHDTSRLPARHGSSWLSRRVTRLSTVYREGSLQTTRDLIEVPERDVDRDAERNGSLNKRTIAGRIRFHPFEHTYEVTKRKRNAEPETVTVRRSDKDVRRSFNIHGGASRFIKNKILEFINKQPQDERSAWFNKNRLEQVFMTQKTLPERAMKPLKRKDGETDDEYDERTAKALDTKREKRERNAAERAELAEHHLVTRFPWLDGVYSVVRQQAIKALCEAHTAQMAKMKKAKDAGKPTGRFKMHFIKRSSPSGTTWTLPAQCIKAEHVERPDRVPTDENPNRGKAVANQSQPQGTRRTWTKLTLPPNFGGQTGGSNAKSTFGGVVYVTQKVDLTADGRPLADVDFTRDRLGRWHAHFQRRPPRVAAPQKLQSRRRTGYADPGSRTGVMIYAPDGVHRDSSHGASLAYMEGEGGASKIFDLCLKLDKLLSTIPKGADGKPTPPTTREERRFLRSLKRQEHSLRARIFNLVRTAHIQICADIWRRLDTLVLPIFDTHRVAKKPMNPNDPRRKINSKTVRQLFSLRHGALRDRLRHTAYVRNKEYLNASEEYTTIGCPSCLRVNPKNTSKQFACTFCGYRGERDEKAGLTLAIKCLSPNWISKSAVGT